MFQTKERGKYSPGGLEQAKWGLDQAVQWTRAQGANQISFLKDHSGLQSSGTMN